MPRDLPVSFVTVDWRSDEGWTVTPDGQIRDRFALRLQPGDTVVSGASDGDGVRLQTALGHQLRVVSGQVTPARGPPLQAAAPARLDTPAGPVQVSGTAVVAGWRYAWTEDGWLLAWPEP